MSVIDYIELPAPLLRETQSFYSSAFAWDWVDYGPTCAATEGNSPDVGLNGLATAGPTHEIGSENSIGPFVLFSTDDLEAIHNRILEAGGTILSEPYDFPGGRRLEFQDPSGNVLGAYQETSPT